METLLVIGLGSMGKRRARLLKRARPQAALCGVDLSPARREEAEALGIRAYESLEAALAAKYLPEGSCGVVSFGVAGGRAAAETFMKNLKLAQIATHVADARTCVLHPANATHRQMNDAELEAAGISADLIRLSCGIEDAADLIADIDQALAAVE